MPEISAGAQVFDLVFHPTHSTVYTGLITGHINAFAYDDQGHYQRTFSVRPSKRSCRALAIDADGKNLYAGGKDKALNILDTVTEMVDIRPKAHDSPVNRIKYLTPWLLSSGDDDGIIKLWDPRQRNCIDTYSHHFDYVSDFLWLEDKRQLVATSGDGTLSVMDVRSSKPKPFAQSEDQEDELLSIVAIKSASKVVVGTQIGILSIFNRKAGWGDCVDRIPGHPHSVDALSNLPPELPGADTGSTILTGSSDGFVRAVKILPTKLLGVVTDHGDWPIEKIAIGSGTSQLTLENDSSEVDKTGGRVGNHGDVDKYQDERVPGRWWVGSVGHEEVVRLSDLGAFFYGVERKDLDDDKGFLDASEKDSDTGDSEDDGLENSQHPAKPVKIDPVEVTELAEHSEGEGYEIKVKKRKRKPEKIGPTMKKGKNMVDVEPTFFDSL